MADWNQPQLGSPYVTFLSNLQDRDVDAITLCLSTPSNTPTGAVRLLRSPVKFQEFNGTTFVDRLLDITGGGTGASSTSGARTNLGLGDMATQNSSAVNITGGSIAAAVAIAAGAIQSGVIAQARLGSGSGGAGTKALFDDQTYKAITPESKFLIGGVQTGDFTATLTEKPTVYMLSGAHTMSLPTVTGHDGMRVGVVNIGGSAWTFSANGAETFHISGATTWSFDFGADSSCILIADANNSRWLVL